MKRTSRGCLILWAAVVVACAHAQVERDLDKKLAAEPAVGGSADLSRQADDLLASDTSLTDDQKRGLRSLWASTELKMDSLHDLSLRLRSLLTRDVVAVNTDQNDVVKIEKKLADIEHRRLDEYFGAVRETNRILGRWGSAGERQRFYDVLDNSSRYIRD